MLFRRSSGGLEKAATALAAAGGVAHVAFFTIFAYRVFSRGSLASYAYVFFAALALVGMALNFVGWALVRHGGKTRARRWGLWAIAASTALAAGLLVVASLT